MEPAGNGDSQDARDEVAHLKSEARRIADSTEVETERVLRLHEQQTAALGDEITRLLADALRLADDNATETQRLHEAHDAATDGFTGEIARMLADAVQRAGSTETEAARVQLVHDRLVRNLEAALESRDLLGQAKGIIMASMQCTADEAWRLIVTQSQTENRKAIDIAREITSHANWRVRNTPNTATP